MRIKSRILKLEVKNKLIGKIDIVSYSVVTIGTQLKENQKLVNGYIYEYQN